MQSALDKVNTHWQAKHITGCGKTPGMAMRDLRTQIRREEAMTRRNFTLEANKEPPQPRPYDCGFCRPGGLDEVCRCGQCVSSTSVVVLSALQEDGCTVCCDASKCEICDPATNTCVSTCSACQTCQDGTCVDTCGECMLCDNGVCVSTCGECTTCNPDTGACEPCRACQVCENGICVDHCGECSHCEPEGCVSDCVDGEHCCGGQCINLSQYKCCTTLAGSFVCPSNLDCCASSQTCCDPNVEQCCEGGCMRYGDSSCVAGACIPCSGDQFCCLKADGSPHGCCESDYTCDPERGCIGNPTISVELPVWPGRP